VENLSKKENSGNKMFEIQFKKKLVSLCVLYLRILIPLYQK